MTTKTLLSFIFLLMGFIVNVQAQEDANEQVELYLTNETNDNVTVLIYPVSMVVNGEDPGQYNLKAISPLIPANGEVKRIDYIIGTNYRVDNSTRNTKFSVGQNGSVNLNYDKLNDPISQADGIFGRGIYKIVFIWNSGYSMDSVLFEQDAGVNIDTKFTLVNDRSQNNYGGPSSKGLVYSTILSTGWEPAKSVSLINGYFKMWDPYPFDPEADRRLKEYGSFTYSTTNNPFTSFPIDPRDFTQINQYDQYHSFPYPLFDWNAGPNYEAVYDDRFGILSLNLTINKNVNSPTTLWDTTGTEIIGNYIAKSADIIVLPGVSLSINSSTNSSITVTLNKFTGISDGTDIIAKATSGSTSGGKLKLLSSTDASKNSNLVVNDKCSVIIENGATLRVEQYGKIKLESGSTMELKEGAISEMQAGARMEITGGTLTLGKNVHLIFDGAGSYLMAASGSKINLGENATIEFKNGAYANIDGVIINDTYEGPAGNGIYFENAGDGSSLPVVKNSTLKNLNIPLKIYNTSTIAANRKVTVQNNNLYIASSGSYGIYADNINQMLIQGNNFYGEKPAVYLKHPGGGSSSSSESSPSPVYDMKITGNVFHSNYVGMVISGQTSAYVPYFIDNNTGTVTTYGILGVKVGSKISNNNISSTVSGSKGCILTQSAANLYKNTFTTVGRALVTSSGYPKLSPYIATGDLLIWDAGRNILESTGDNCIELNLSDIYIGGGQNKFTKPSGSYHLFGRTSGTYTYLSGNNNCWLPTGASNSVVNINQAGVTISTTNDPGLQCTSIAPVSYTVDNLGDGIYDTIYATAIEAPSSENPPPTEDELLYGQAADHKRYHFFLDAITEYQSLIDTFKESPYLTTAISDMYSCFQELDTFNTQEHRDTLFGSLKVFLENKIASEDYGNDFNMAAYDALLMCETQIQDYEAAATGYEFLSLYHPSPEVRLLSSEELAIIEDLMEGEGGSIESSMENVQLTIEKNAERIKRKIDRLISGDPVLQKVRESYEKIRNESKEKTERELKSKYSKEEAEVKINKKKETEQKFDNRIRENFAITRTLNKEQQEQRHLETLMMVARGTDAETSDKNENNIVPNNYSLSQNYPNPFNPVTKINYQLPSANYVKLNVYDITGKLVKVLVNELQPSGNYSIEFDGSPLSSGVYFYRLETGSFVETKRMVLIK